jgi:hypothetical protein
MAHDCGDSSGAGAEGARAGNKRQRAPKCKPGEETSCVQFKRAPPSWAAEVLAASTELGARPDDALTQALKKWTTDRDKLLKAAWKALGAPGQHEQLRRFPREVAILWKDAPKEWVSSQMEHFDEKTDRDAYKTRMEQVQADWNQLSPQEQHDVRESHGRKRQKKASVGTAPEKYLEAGYTQEEWAALVQACRVDANHKDAHGKNVFVWLEEQRLDVAGQGAERTEHLSLPRMALQGQDSGAEEWRRRRKIACKSVDSAFREGEFKGREAEWDAMTPGEQQKTLEDWRARHNIKTNKPKTLDDTMTGAGTKTRRDKKLHKLTNELHRERSRSHGVLALKTMLVAHRRIKSCSIKIGSKVLKRDRRRVEVRSTAKKGPGIGRERPMIVNLAARWAERSSRPAAAPMSTDRTGHPYLTGVDKGRAGMLTALFQPSSETKGRGWGLSAKLTAGAIGAVSGPPQYRTPASHEAPDVTLLMSNMSLDAVKSLRDALNKVIDGESNIKGVEVVLDDGQRHEPAHQRARRNSATPVRTGITSREARIEEATRPGLSPFD